MAYTIPEAPELQTPAYIAKINQIQTIDNIDEVQSDVDNFIIHYQNTVDSTTTQMTDTKLSTIGNMAKDIIEDCLDDIGSAVANLLILLYEASFLDKLIDLLIQLSNTTDTNERDNLIDQILDFLNSILNALDQILDALSPLGEMVNAVLGAVSQVVSIMSPCDQNDLNTKAEVMTYIDPMKAVIYTAMDQNVDNINSAADISKIAIQTAVQNADVQNVVSNTNTSLQDAKTQLESFVS